MNNKFMVV